MNYPYCPKYVGENQMKIIIIIQTFKIIKDNNQWNLVLVFNKLFLNEHGPLAKKSYLVFQLQGNVTPGFGHFRGPRFYDYFQLLP